MNIESLLKYERRHRGLYNFLPREMGAIKETDAETYSFRAKFFDQKKALHMERPDFTKPLREKGKDGVFFELACGSASHGLNMMKDGYKMVETDIAEGAVEKVREFAENLGIRKNGAFAVIDAEEMPFKDETMDGGFMIASLHHIPNPQKALKEIHRTLKKDGVFIIGYEPAAWQYYAFFPFIKLFRFIIRKRNANRPTSLADDVTFGFSKRKLKKMLRSAGFSRMTVTPVYYTYKTYKNYCILLSKLTKTEPREHKKIANNLKSLDKTLAKIPLIKNLTWDWDVVAYK
jgi:ubiquinone/menaquinone biosynthesis C-methylase UbiE